MIRALSAVLALASILVWALFVDRRDAPDRTGIGGARGEWE